MLKGIAAIWLWAQDPAHRQRVTVLARTELFAGMRKRLLGRVAIRMFEKSYAPGEEIFCEGDPGKALFVVVEGRVEVVRRGEAGEQRLGELGEESVFGEMALVDDLPRSATARASAPTRLLLLYRSHFDELMERDPRVGLALSRSLLRTLARYVRSRQVTEEAPPVVAAASSP
jgi:CRP/FNR family cyclic AMP-dependent transcriptional regulator